MTQNLFYNSIVELHSEEFRRGCKYLLSISSLADLKLHRLKESGKRRRREARTFRDSSKRTYSERRPKRRTRSKTKSKLRRKGQELKRELNARRKSNT